MKVRWLPRMVYIASLAVLFTLAANFGPTYAGETGTVPPFPAASSGWGDEIGASLHAVSLIF